VEHIWTKMVLIIRV